MMVNIDNGTVALVPESGLRLVPSQVSISSGVKQTDSHGEKGEKSPLRMNHAGISPDNVNESTTQSKSRKKRRDSHSKSKPRKNATTATTATKSQKRQPRRRRSGNLPDVQWRAIPHHHLRLHPLYKPLPPPSEVHLHTAEDARYFRQSSWQWDALHRGRVTTAHVAAVLGFLEPKAAKELGLPRSWVDGGRAKIRRSVQQLRLRPIRTLEDMQRELLCEEEEEEEEDSSVTESEVWSTPSNFPFAAKYLPRGVTATETRRRRTLAKDYFQNDKTGMAVRMAWGNAQESTSVLTALNYFSKKKTLRDNEPGVTVREVGMCGAGLDINTTSGLLLGASPDALISYPDGTTEVLEVKNHCPFFSPYKSPKHKNKFMIRDFDHANFTTVPPMYIPQLTMQMLCVGEECRSAVMIRQTATNGAVVLRLQRTDTYMNEMLYWIQRFHKDFVQDENVVLPPVNFFWDGDSPQEVKRYKKFVAWTKEMGKAVEWIERIEHTGIQRVMAPSNQNFTPFFLD